MALGYDISGDYLEVKVEHLNLGSRQVVPVECDFCKEVKYVTYKEYLRNISIGGKYACSKDCGSAKAKKTNLKKYGVDYPMILEDFQNKVKETNLKKYGVEFLQQSEVIKDKTKQKVKEKWGVDHISKSEEIRLTTSKISLDDNYIKYLSNNQSLFKCDLKLEHEFEINGDNYYHRKKNNLPLCTVCNPIGDSQSIKEKNLYEFIKSIYHGEITRSYRDGLEIDIYLPELKLGFEFNGLYWHSEEWKNKWYHLNKTTYFKDKDITVIHIWEDDWTFKEPIIKSQIRNWISLTKNRIYARSCEIMEVPTEPAIIFLNKNHIQGKDKSMIKMGLYYNNELVSLMTFNKSEGRKKMENGGWNLSRFCNKIDTSVIGGSSKILSHFIKIHKPSRIVSYADRDWSTGDLYYKLGFNKVCERKPDYKYIINRIRVNKSRYRKSNLKTELSESKYMMSKSINRIWDCGKIKFEKIL